MNTTLILGASDKPDRFAYRALTKLLAANHPVVAVTPKGGVTQGITCIVSLTEVSEPIDTVTVYINPERLTNEIENLLHLSPRRVIFNPGSESPEASKRLTRSGIEIINDCTLMMLDGNRY